MVLSLWSGFFDALGLEEAMRELAAAGFGHTEIAWEMSVEPGATSFSEQWFERVRQAAASAEIATPQLHYPIRTLNPRVVPAGEHDPELEADLAHPQEGRRRFEIDCLEQLIGLCPRSGVRVIVLHPGGCRGVEGARELDRVRALNVEALSHLAPLAARHGVNLALENMARVGGKRQFGAAIRELQEVLRAVGAPNLGVCLDTSHARLAGEDIPAAIESLGQTLVATHISDNLGTHDDHLLPYSGTIDWPPVLAALERVGYAGLLNLEIPGEIACPLPILRLKARHALRLLELMSGAGDPG